MKQIISLGVLGTLVKCDELAPNYKFKSHRGPNKKIAFLIVITSIKSIISF